MMTTTASSPRLPLASLRLSSLALLTIAAIAPAAHAQRAARIVAQADNNARITLTGSRPPIVDAANDAGLIPQSTVIQGISINFSRSAAQQATLEALLAAQQNPGSPLYHQWLTPDQFAQQFGMADADIAAVEDWLTAQGFTVNSVSRGLNRIEFTGTEAQVEAAFQTQIHNFTVAGETHYAPAYDLTIPAAFASTIQSVGNLSSFRPHSHLRQGTLTRPDFTSSQTGSHFLSPKDVVTLYDIAPVYTKGYTGAGQSIAIVGQSAVILSDIALFQSAAGQTASGVTAKAPIPVLYPGTGAATLYTGDESESDLDLEYSSAIAPGAQVYFVYTGSSTNYGVFDAVNYAINNRIAPIISASYGSCEPTVGASTYASYNAIFQQAAAQGQTLIASSGDEGSTNCYSFTSVATATRIGLAVGFPVDSPYVTGIGGTEFAATAVASTNNTYFSAASGSDVISSVISYIPEQAWNDDSTSGLSSGGGGQSIFAARPSFQSSAVPGISAISGNGFVPAGIVGALNAPGRLVPDISLDSSPNNAGYLYCSSDTSDTGVEGSCTNGFRDASSKSLTVAGGTSFAAPIFAGMMALINQGVHANGQGAINSTLYTLASNSTTYASAFHDITTGNNACTASPAALSCATSGTTSFTAATGYDEATGLGSVDLSKLLSAWPVASAAAASTTVLTAATTVPKISATDAIAITVTGSAVVPTGTVTITVNGTAQSPIALSGGSATYSFSSAVAGQVVLVANYSGDANYAPSSSTVLLQVGGAGTFNLGVSNTTVTDGSTATISVTATSVNGYAGTVGLAISTSPSIYQACYTVTNAVVPAGGSGTATITVYTNQTSCTTATTTLTQPGGKRLFQSAGGSAANRTPAKPRSPNPVPAGVAFAGLLAVGFLGRRSRALRSLVAVALLSIAAFGLSACGGSSSSAASVPTTYATTGAYTIIVQGYDTTTTSNTNFANFTLTIQ